MIQYAKDNYSDDCGGGIHNGRGVFVRVTDTHGNVAELAELESLYFTRWDNTTAPSDGGAESPGGSRLVGANIMKVILFHEFIHACGLEDHTPGDVFQDYPNVEGGCT